MHHLTEIAPSQLPRCEHMRLYANVMLVPLYLTAIWGASVLDSKLISLLSCMLLARGCLCSAAGAHMDFCHLLHLLASL